MARSFLIRGMLCGVAAGILIFLFARYFGEPGIDGAIGVEEALAKMTGEMEGPELVSRDLQSTWGLFTGVMLYSVAIGGLFSLLFAFAWGRVGRLSVRATSAILAGASFVAIYAVPFLKYPANPPSIGSPETIGYRTALYFGMVVISIIAMVAALNLGRALLGRMERWNAILLGGVAYVAIIIVACVVMPSINEVPETFPAVLLWQFRLSSLGMQLLLWGVLGLAFGELTARSLRAGAVAATPTPAR
jgi:Probable cobalt transporter subunit (CbtA)